MTPRDDAHDELKALLYASFRARPHPIIQDATGVTPAATMWAIARTWVAFFRASGLTAGDRVVLALEPSIAHVGVTIAAWWEGLTLCPIPTSSDPERSILDTDARLYVGEGEDAHIVGVGDDRCPIDTGVRPREATHERSLGIALLMRTSGVSSGSPRRVALSYANVLAQLRTHTDAIGHDERSVAISVLPWHHAFGLLVDAWPALLGGAWLIADPGSARDPDRLIREARAAHATHISAVPLQLRRVLEAPGGAELLEGLSGGVVGGARVGADLAHALGRTRLRAGYGQTEASPGITLGDPGRWCEGLIGQPVGCRVRIESGTLRVQGPNVCCGFWEDGLQRHDPDRWLDTGDRIAMHDEHGYIFLGRRDHRFKLSNGRMIDAPALEARVRGVLPADTDAVLLPDRAGMSLVLVGPSPADTNEIVRALDDAGGVLNRVVHIADSHSVRSHKGDIDRRALARLLDDSPIKIAA